MCSDQSYEGVRKYILENLSVIELNKCDSVKMN